jgi:hypothetical protein
MAHKFIYANKDAWISDISSSHNFGGDEILELRKYFTTGATGSNVSGVSRILTYFDITDISKSMYVDNDVSKTAEFYLKYYATEASSLDHTYDLISHAVSGSWEEGTGKLSDNPMKSDGVSWKNYDGRYEIYTWSLHNPGQAMSSSQSGSHSNGRPESGGGVFFTSSGFYGTQSFSYVSPDTDIRVTDVVGKWLSGSGGQTFPSGVPNNGFITMWSGSQESSSLSMGDLKFFSTNTHTIYPPKLEVRWDDTKYEGIASLDGEITMSGLIDNYVYVKGIRPEYRETENVKFRIGARERHITKRFFTSVQTLTSSYIPCGSGQYSIQDYQTGETLVPFGNYTSMSCDAKGNYFKQDLNSFFPNRHYKILLKVNYEDGQEIIYDDDFIFKIVR